MHRALVYVHSESRFARAGNLPQPAPTCPNLPQPAPTCRKDEHRIIMYVFKLITCTSRLLPTTCLYPFTGMYWTFLSAQPAWHMVIFELVVPLNSPFSLFLWPSIARCVHYNTLLLYYNLIIILFIYYIFLFIILLSYYII